MAFKKMILFSCVAVMTVVSYNVLETEALSIDPSSTNAKYTDVKRNMLSLQETEMNLMNDLQRLIDLQTEYQAGLVSYSLVQQAQKEFCQTKNQWFRETLKYLNSQYDLESLINLKNQIYSNQLNSQYSMNSMKANLLSANAAAAAGMPVV